jgi:hypothetical protein
METSLYARHGKDDRPRCAAALFRELCRYEDDADRRVAAGSESISNQRTRA